MALAIASPTGTYTRELHRGTNDRNANMVAFAKEGLELLKDVIEGDNVGAML